MKSTSGGQSGPAGCESNLDPLLMLAPTLTALVVGMMTLSCFVATPLAAASPPPVKKERPMEIGAMFGGNLLPNFRDEPGCDGSTSKFVELMLQVDEATFEGNLAQRRVSALKDGQTVASNYNRAAQVAADKGCLQLARKWWLHVIEGFVGSGYSAMRQRAQIGIDDLRAAAAKPPVE